MVQFETELIHADEIKSRVTDIAPPINVSTTYAYTNDPSKLIPADEMIMNEGWIDDGIPVYSRESHPNSEAAEAILSSLFKRPAVVYNSGMGAFNAILFHLNPKRLFYGQCYQGCKEVGDLFTRIGALKVHDLNDEELEKYLQPGDLIHLETPVNPEGLCFDITHYSKIAHSKGAYLSIDSTFAPYPLQDPFEFGADIVMHSATKYLGGHSDLLAGVLIVKDLKKKHQLLEDRIGLGTNIANLESFLLIRSLRTYPLRIKQQSASAEKLVKFLVDHQSEYGCLKKIYHSSLQKEDFVRKQMPNGFGAVFSFDVTNETIAKTLPSRLKYFRHATSLGGVESLIEWRALSDPRISKTLLRISVGLENVEDLILDLDQALKSFSD